MQKLSKYTDYKNLIKNIGSLLIEGRRHAYQSINKIMISTYWNIGKKIVEFEQGGNIKAKYGKKLLINLSKELRQYGAGFSRSNLTYMRLLYILYPISETLSHQLTWSHYFELLKIENNLARSFYEKQCLREKWSVRELKRQKNSMLFERIALSKNKEGVLKISRSGQVIEKSEDILKEPYVLEFLGIPEDYRYSEQELEQKIIDNLQMFLLEMGRGFTFVKRQFRMGWGNSQYYVDLVFYHRILKCFVLIDLKIGEVEHGDIGQMNMYLNYFKTEENSKEENDPIGIILSAEKDEIKMEYALGGISNKLFVSKYLLYLPNKEDFEEEIKRLI